LLPNKWGYAENSTKNARKPCFLHVLNTWKHIHLIKIGKHCHTALKEKKCIIMWAESLPVLSEETNLLQSWGIHKTHSHFWCVARQKSQFFAYWTPFTRRRRDRSRLF